jgi:hypothetical protein
MITVSLEFNPVFIERDSMTELADRSVRGGCKWEQYETILTEQTASLWRALGAEFMSHVENGA